MSALSLSPFASSPLLLHSFRLPKSSSGRSGCGEHDWSSMFHTMLDDASSNMGASGSVDGFSAFPSSGSFSAIAAAASPPFLSPLDGAASSPLLISPKLFQCPLDSMSPPKPSQSRQSPSPLFASTSGLGLSVSPRAYQLQPSHPTTASSLSASLSARRHDDLFSARGDAASSSSASCPDKSFVPAVPAPPPASSASSSSFSGSSVPAAADDNVSMAPSVTSTSTPSRRSGSRAPSTSSALSDMSSEHYLTFELLDIDAVTGAISTEDTPFSPSNAAVFDFVSLHQPLQDALLRASGAPSSSAVRLDADEADAAVMVSRSNSPASDDGDGDDDDGEELDRISSPVMSAFYSSGQQHATHHAPTASHSYPHPSRSSAAAASASSAGHTLPPSGSSHSERAGQQRQGAGAQLPAPFDRAPRYGGLNAVFIADDCGLFSNDFDGRQRSELPIARARTAGYAADQGARKRGEAVNGSDLSPRAVRRSSFSALRSITAAAASTGPPLVPLSPSMSVTSTGSSPLSRSAASDDEGHSSSSSLHSTPSHSPHPMMAPSVAPASVMAHQITPVTATRVTPVPATAVTAAAVSELPVVARSVSASSAPGQHSPVTASAAPVLASASPLPGCAGSGLTALPVSVLRSAGGGKAPTVSVGTVIAEASLASPASASSMPSSPRLATAAAASSLGSGGAVTAHPVSVLAASSLSSPGHRARVVAAAGIHPRQAFALPRSKKQKHKHYQHHPQHVALCLAALPTPAPVAAHSAAPLHATAMELDVTAWPRATRAALQSVRAPLAQ